MGAKYAQIQIKTQEDATGSESEVEIKKVNALLAKGQKINLETLKNEVLRMDKSLKRHDRDLTKLKPVTLQAPDAANRDSDLLSCLIDIMMDRLGLQFKHLFVTRNEF